MSDEGEDPSPRPKRKIKKVMVLSSASGSDSDDSGPTTSTRKKRLRVLSEDGSDSSSGSWAIGAIRRRRALPGLRDSDGGSESSGWATDHSDAPQPSMSTAAAAAAVSSGSKSPTNTSTKPVCGFTSDSSEGNTEKCSICLMKFLNQEVGTPQNCEHIFCLDCITEWSRNMNTCPVDRIAFDEIVVRACAGGRVLRTEQVKVAERRPSLEMMIIEDPTVCEVCRNADREESMLLCDGCDLGFHMQCLTPPLTRVPEDQWLCPSCNGVWVTPFQPPTFVRSFNGVHQNWDNMRALRPTPDHQPSTSSGLRHSAAPRPAPRAAPPASRRSALSDAGASTSRRTTNPRARKRKYQRRKTRTVIIEYEVQGDGKFPITKTKKVKTRIKKRRKTRQPRTAARRTLVRESVRARLAALRSPAGASPSAGAGVGAAAGGPSSAGLAARRARAGIAPLSLFGSAYDLEYFEEEEEQGSEGATTAVAVRPTSAILDAYRQARRKMVSIPSPTHASSAPDLLSNILESQTLLHSKRSVVSVTVDGSVNIKLQTRERGETKKGDILKNIENKKDKKEDIVKDNKVDLTKTGESSRQAPAYPGQGRGWGGGYRYPRDQNNHHQNHNQGNQGYGRGGYDNGYGGPQQRGPNGGGGGVGGGGQYDRRDDDNGQYNDYHNRRPHQYSNDEEPWHDRNRRQQLDQNRGLNNNQRDDRRFSGGPLWQGHRRDGPPHRQSFGGFDNALDMRLGHEPPHPVVSRSLSHPGPERDKPYQPLPQPPAFQFNNVPERDRSEDEKSDEGLVIDTEKYDPTEPTNDDDSGDDDAAVSGAPPAAEPELEAEPEVSPPSPTPPAAPSPSVERILAGIESRGLAVPAAVLDSAVRAALEEHRAARDALGGDCPNFSIYSATSVHIACDSTRTIEAQPARADSLEDLVQEDGELTPPPHPPPPPPPPALEPDAPPTPVSAVVATASSEEYKAKVSKRCPITTSTRNPIKIKLNAPSLIRRQVSLYDDEDLSEEVEERAEPFDVPAESVPDEKAATDETEEREKPDGEPAIESQIPLENTDDPKEDGEADDGGATPHVSDEDATPARLLEPREGNLDDDRTDDELDKDKTKSDSEDEASTRSGSARAAAKMTESISETEDERSYTPCLDENKSKDASLEDKGVEGLEGLETEMISEEEGNDMFCESSPPAPEAPPPEEGEILDKKSKSDDTKKKKKNSKKEKDGKGKGRKRIDVTFKKIGKGKDRNYRERDKDADRKRSPASSRERRRRKDKRKDLERYDVRTLVSERRRRTKDAFGRDVSPSGSRSPSPAHPALSPSPRRTGPSPSPRRVRLSPSPRRARSSLSPRRGRLSLSPRRARLSPSPRRARLSPSPRRARPSPSPRRARFSPSPLRRRGSTSPRRPRLSPSPRRIRISPSPRRRMSQSPRRGRASPSPRRPPSASPPSPKRRRKRSGSRAKAPRRRRSASRVRKRRRSASPSSPKPTKAKKKKRARSKAGSKTPARRRSPRRKRARRRSASPPAPPPAEWAPPPERAPSPRTPPPAEPIPMEERRRRREVERAHRRLREAAGPSKEVFTSGDNILVSVSFKEQERVEGIGRRSRRRSRRRRRRAAEAEAAAGAKPVAIIDLERSPFRELTPSPKNVIVLSDDEAPAEAPPADAAQGPKTPPEPAGAPAQPPVQASANGPAPAPEASPPRGPLTPPEPPDSPDAYDPYEPTRSASGSPPAPAAPAPAAAAPAPSAPAAAAAAAALLNDDDRPSMTLEAAQKTNLSADEVLDRRPLSPIEKVMALLQSTRDVSPEEPTQREAGASPGGGGGGGGGTEFPAALSAPPAPAPAPAPAAAVPPAPRILLPDQPRQTPKLFLAKPSPIKSDPIKPMPQATKISRLPLPAVVAGVRRRSASPSGGASPYSPGSSDFGDLFEPPHPHPAAAGASSQRKDTFDALIDKPSRPSRKGRNGKSKRGKKSKTTVDVKLDDDNLKILEELPNSAVEMQVKSKVSNFLKKLNRQERVVEEVKLVLKPHYNKKHVSKEEYKHILRRAVPKICHNKTGEINPTKIQALVEAYVKKFRKKRKLGQ